MHSVEAGSPWMSSARDSGPRMYRQGLLTGQKKLEQYQPELSIDLLPDHGDLRDIKAQDSMSIAL